MFDKYLINEQFVGKQTLGLLFQHLYSEQPITGPDVRNAKHSDAMTTIASCYKEELLASRQASMNMNGEMNKNNNCGQA